MSDKAEYIQEVEKQLDSWQSEIYKLKIIAEDAGWEDPDRQIDCYQIIEEITAKEKEVAQKLASLKRSNDRDWHDLKTEIDIMREEITRAVESARASVN